MVLFFVTDIAREMLQALSWTLIHSLWQGVLLSVIAATIIFSTRDTSPQVRYNLLLSALLVFIVAVASTFSLQLLRAKLLIDSAPFIPTVQTQLIQPVQPAITKNNLPIVDAIIYFIDNNAGSIVLAWLLIIALQFMRLSAGLYNVNKLKNRQVMNAGDYWNERIAALSMQLQIQRRVQILQSAIVKIPSVIGYFKPVILFPAGMLASLPPEEIEAVLLHELAHIRRKDFLVNLLQQLVEIIFFFNPAVLWVSSLIKSGRENCCDEIAVQQTKSKQHYINALLSFEAFNLPQAAILTTAFNGEKNQLMNRIKRIIYNNNKTLNNMEKKFLAAGIIVTSVLIFSFTANNAQTQTPGNNRATGITIQTDTVPSPSATDQLINGTINSTQNGKKYMLVTENNQVKELYVDGKKIPEEKMDNYKKVTAKILTDTKIELEQSQKEMAESAKEMEQSKKEMEEAKLELGQSQKEMAESARELEQSKKEMDEAAKEMALDKEQADKDIEQSKRDIAQSNIEMAGAKIEMEKAEKEMKEDLKQSKLDVEHAAKDMAQAKRDMEQAAKDEALAKKDEERARLLQEKIIAGLIKEHIITDKNELSSYELSNNGLIVNGVKQPDEIFKKFKDQYIKDKHFSMSYNRE
ncbi:MAG: peptidase BlaR1 [Ferruginibacter sp.]|uniref:M56 family metallopeptidase n=1 Tax=Ferruginibacter sp. TaxID=1940288 RepID=UPI0026595B09|nr:M56 family metallopeptidase [Ferruginibacter sp.]MDB5280056.1 peptidase BlaR1 [Ferruginibacter sp.]